MKTIIAISVISMLALGMSILPTSVYAQGGAYNKGYNDASCDAVSYHGHGYEQVVQVIIVVNTARIIEMGMLQDGMLQVVLQVVHHQLINHQHVQTRAIPIQMEIVLVILDNNLRATPV
jgi:6-pyruvoyl-tetrahydropterin synthase